MRRWLPNAIAGAALVALALASGIGWRVELEWQGWPGTSWVHRPHRAFPIAMAAFVAWSIAVAMLVHRTRGWRLALLAALLSALGVTGYFAIPQVLLFAFGGWGGGVLSMELAAGPQYLAEIPDFLGKELAREVLLRDLLFWGAWLTPTIVLWGVLRASGIRSPLWSVPVSALVQFWAWPVTIWVLMLLDHKGGANPQHALKSGLVIPWLVFAIGIPLLVTPAARSSSE